MSDYKPELVVAVVFITGFAIQQLLQIADPLITLSAVKVKAWQWFKDFPNITDGDLKKSLMYAGSFGLGLIAVLWTKISLLGLINSEWGTTLGDNLVSALVVGSGTEATNTVLKYLGYIKEAKKTEIIEVLIVPSATTVLKSQTCGFRAIVKNTANTAVEWEVLEGATGGSIDKLTGLYTAPAAAGTYRIIAVSQADSTKYSIAVITVPN